MNSINAPFVDIYTPSVSADMDIDLATLGITLDYQPFSSLSEARSCSGCWHKHNQVTNSTKKIDAVLLTDYCLQRLAEIRRINELSHTPSAFSCLMSFIGFLSSLVYENMTELDAYTRFCHDYVKELYCFKNIVKKKSILPRTSGHPKNNSWGEVIYSLIRCGLVHNMNVSGNKNSGQDQIKVALTHEPFHGANCRVYKFGPYDKAKLVAENDDAVVLVINVFDLCDSVQRAIIRMFQKSKVRASASRVLGQRPVIEQISY